MKQPTYFPFYNIHSDLVKTALGVKDARSVRGRLKDAGIEIKTVGTMEIVTCEDLLNISENKKVFVPYQGKSKHSEILNKYK